MNIQKLLFFLFAQSLYCQIDSSWYDDSTRDSCFRYEVNGRIYFKCINKYTNTISKAGKYITLNNTYLTFYHLGYKFYEGAIKNDSIKTGLWTYYYLDGTEVHQGNYKNNLKVGEWRVYKCKHLDFRINGDYHDYYVESNFYSNGKAIRSKVKKKLTKKSCS